MTSIVQVRNGPAPVVSSGSKSIGSGIAFVGMQVKAKRPLSYRLKKMWNKLLKRDF